MRALRWFRALGFPSVSGQKGRFGVEIGATMHMSGCQNYGPFLDP